MNLRMKAKRFKRLYEGLANMPVHSLEVTHCPIDRLKAQKSFPMRMALGNELLVRQAVVRELGMAIANGLDEYIDYTVEKDFYRGEYNVTAEVRVVRKGGE